MNSPGQNNGPVSNLVPLKVENLSKSYGSLKAVDDVSFEVQPGEVFGLLGPNGAGKTSLISTITTLEKPTSGRILVQGHDVVKNSRAAKLNLGVVPQELINHGYFNVEEVLNFHSGYFGISNNKPRIEFLLKRLGLFEHKHKKIKQLSGGMKRRLLIAKALVHRPKILLLDEPTAGVDIELRNSLWEFVKDLRSEGVSVLLTTHYLEEAEQLCDRVAIIHKGKLRRMGPTKQLVRDLTSRLVKVETKGGIEISNPYLISSNGNEFEFRIPATLSSSELLAQLNLDMKMVRDIQIREGNLEDAFRFVLGENAGSENMNSINTTVENA